MAKLLLFIVVGFIAYKWWRNLQAGGHSNQPSQPVENMVRCRLCGVHVPQSDACGDATAWFCCADHEREFHSGNKV
jgi:uncharacterized protein